MSDRTIPVMIHLPAETFLVLEAAARRKGMPMRDLIVAWLMRSTQPRPHRGAAGQIASSTPGGGKRGYRRLDAAEWAELRRLRTAGWSVPELAVKYGCSSSVIYYHLRGAR